MNVERMAQAFPPGTIIGDRFCIEQIAGVGGMGAVYRAKDQASGALVALKILIDHSEAGMDRFARESDVLAQLEHPAIVRHVAHGQTLEGEAWLAMEWLEGEDLASCLRREGLRVSESLGLAERLAEALGDAHVRGVVHRDIKPSNIFLPGGRWEDAKILDFGIARPLAAKTALTRTGTIMGTPGYMAPEQLEGNASLDARADVFSLGAVLFECLTGKPAFAGEHVMAVLARLLLEEAPRVDEFRSDISPNVVDLVARMLSRDRDKRPVDGHAVARALAEVGRSTGAPPAIRAIVPALTGSEQRMLCVVVALTQPPGQTGSALSVTVQSVLSPALLAALKHAVATLDARVDEVVGALLVSLTGAYNPGDQAARAARCALAMRALLPGVPMVIVTGRGEASGRLPVGPVVDRAASLLARSGRADRDGETQTAIWVDDVTRAWLDVRFDVLETAAGAELLGEREVGEASRSLLGKATPCVGREREIGMIEAAVEATLSEETAHVVLVTGPPGIGKSRVRYEVTRRLRQRFSELSIWVGRADQIRSGSAYFLIGSALRHAAGITGNETPEVRREKLCTLVAVVRPEERSRVAGFLGEIVGEPFPDEAAPLLRAARQDAAVMANEVRRAFDDFIETTSRQQAICLVLEDLHWADMQSMRCIERALGALRDRPFCVIALARSEVREVFPKLFAERTLDEIRLGELGRKAAERLVKHALGEQVHPTTLAKIIERAAGNAFVLEEMIRAVAERRSDTLPETVLGMVEARLASLQAEERRALRAASIFGETFWASGIALLAFADRGVEAQVVLDKLVEREVLKHHGTSRFAGEREYSFRHALIREGAHAMLTGADRTLGHKLAAEWLERLGETDPVVLAEHWEQAGEGTHAARWFARAAHQALRVGDYALAETRADRGFMGKPEGELLAEMHVIKAEAFAFQGKIEESLVHAEIAKSLSAPGSRTHTLALAGIVTNTQNLGDPSKLIEAIPILLAVEPTPDARATFAWALSLVADAVVFAGQVELVEQFVAKLDRLAESGEELAVGWQSQSRALAALVIDDDPFVAVQLFMRARDLFERGGNFQHAAYVHARLCFALLALGALDRVEEELGKVSAIPGGIVEAMTSLTRTLLGLASGNPRAAISSALDALTKVGANQFIASAQHLLLARAYLTLGDFDHAEEYVDLYRSSSLGLPGDQVVLAVLDAGIALGRGDANRAIELAQRAIDGRGAPMPHGPYVPLAYVIRARAVEVSGNAEAVRASIKEAREWLLARAEKVHDLELRKCFLEGVPEHASILAIASALGV